MTLLRLFKPRVLLALGFGAIVSASVSGLAAANTVPTSKAGDGLGAISGYTISSVKYTLNASDPRNIDQVTFNINTAIGATYTAKIKLVSGGTQWYSCTIVTTAATCATTSPAAPVQTADELRVVIADS